MQIFTKEDLLEHESMIIKEIISGKIFIYPTDTIYGIGCNAVDDKAVKKIRKIKQRKDQPFSIIAPSKKWIQETCEVHEKNLYWLDKLPGPYTFVMKMKNKKAVSKYVNPDIETIGIRIPKHWFSKFIEDIGIPIVTTSVNKSGEQYMTSMDDLDPEIKRQIDYIFYEGERTGKPSTLVIFDKDKSEVKER